MLQSRIRQGIHKTIITPKFERKVEDPSNQAVPDPENGGRASMIDAYQSIRNLQDYLNNERGQIVLTIQHSETSDEANRWVGKDLWETYEINIAWITKVSRFFLYYLIGVLTYQNLEKWSFQDCVYFLTQTITTVGYGNITPSTKSGQIFTIFYLYLGILLAFSIINEVTRFFVLYLRSNYKRPKKLNKFQVFVRHSINVGMWIVILFLIPLFGALVFKSLENDWSWEDALYFSVITSTSVGYGDRNVTNPAAVWFNCFFIVFAVSTTALALDKISSFKRHLKKAELWQILEDIQPSKALIDAINPKSDKASRAEYILHMLQLEGKLDFEEDITRWDDKFDEFDIDHDGFLSLQDVDSFQKDLQRRQLSQSLSSRSESNSVSSSTTSSKQLLSAITDEAKDVFLETIGFKTEIVAQQTRRGSTLNATANGAPKERAIALRRASTLNFNTEQKISDDVRPSTDGIELKTVERSNSPLRGKRGSVATNTDNQSPKSLPQSDGDITSTNPLHSESTAANNTSELTLSEEKKEFDSYNDI
eukprot:gene11121-12118_t